MGRPSNVGAATQHQCCLYNGNEVLSPVLPFKAASADTAFRLRPTLKEVRSMRRTAGRPPCTNHTNVDCAFFSTTSSSSMVHIIGTASDALFVPASMSFAV